MTNHPNRAPVYRVHSINGQFSHARGKSAALAEARRQCGAPLDAPEDDLRKHWGVTVERVSTAVARSVGL